MVAVETEWVLRDRNRKVCRRCLRTFASERSLQIELFPSGISLLAREVLTCAMSPRENSCDHAVEIIACIVRSESLFLLGLPERLQCSSQDHVGVTVDESQS